MKTGYGAFFYSEYNHPAKPDYEQIEKRRSGYAKLKQYKCSHRQAGNTLQCEKLQA
jgi:hypothetical protein